MQELISTGAILLTIRQYTQSDVNSVLGSWEVATRLAHAFMTDDFIAQERKNIVDIYLPNTEPGSQRSTVK